jgi:hypothetical protein
MPHTPGRGAWAALAAGALCGIALVLTTKHRHVELLNGIDGSLVVSPKPHPPAGRSIRTALQTRNADIRGFLRACAMRQGASQLAGGYKSISTNSVSLEGKVDQMLKKVKAIKSDFYNLEADFKTQAHRQLSISLKPRGDKGPTGLHS